MEVTAETKFKRYLHYACEDGIYIPGCRFHFGNYAPENLTSLPILVADEKEDDIIAMIQKVVDEKTSVYPEAIIFALAQCVRDKNHPNLRQKAYLMVEKICTSTEFLFTFFKFSHEINPKCGSGRACRRLLKNWYLNKTALQLAEVVTWKPKYKGWRHADLIKLAHIKSSDPAKAVILKYVTKGLTSAVSEYENVPEAQQVLSYLKTVHSFRQGADPTVITRTIEYYMLTVDHLKYSLLKNKEVWIALLRLMPLSVLLDHFQFLSRNRMFRKDRLWDYNFINSVCDALENPSKLKESGLHPSRIYIELNNYKNAARVKLELGNIRLRKTPPSVCEDIVKTLNKVFCNSLKLLKPTGLTYIIGIGVPLLKTKSCGYSRYLSCVHAAGLITLCLLKTEKNVDILTSSVSDPSWILPVHLPVDSSIDDFVSIISADQGYNVFQKYPLQHQQTSNISSLFSWGTRHNKKVDVFIYLSLCVKPSTSFVEEFKKYKVTEQVPNARLVICDLCGMPRKTSIIESPDILTISGFDHKVCQVIEAFSKGAF